MGGHVEADCNNRQRRSTCQIQLDWVSTSVGAADFNCLNSSDPRYIVERSMFVHNVRDTMVTDHRYGPWHVPLLHNEIEVQ